MIKVIFVCHGNYHRSPMAQGLFQKLIQQNDLKTQVFCDSAGTVCTHPEIEPHIKTLELLKDEGITLEHKARIFNYKDLTSFDYIIAMDHFNIRDIFYLKKQIKHNKENIYLLRQFDPEIKNYNITSLAEAIKNSVFDVPDPELFYLEDYKKVYEIINRSIKNLFAYLYEKNNF